MTRLMADVKQSLSGLTALWPGQAQPCTERTAGWWRAWPGTTGVFMGARSYTLVNNSWYKSKKILISLFEVGFWIPFFVILFSTMIIWYKAYHKHLQDLPASDIKEFLQMESTLILVFFSYCLFPLPLLAMELSPLWSPCLDNKELFTWMCYNFYWWLFLVFA